MKKSSFVVVFVLWMSLIWPTSASQSGFTLYDIPHAFIERQAFYSPHYMDQINQSRVYCHLNIVVDKKLTKYFENVDRIRQYVNETINYVNQIYRQNLAIDGKPIIGFDIKSMSFTSGLEEFNAVRTSSSKLIFGFNSYINDIILDTVPFCQSLLITAEDWSRVLGVALMTRDSSEWNVADQCRNPYSSMIVTCLNNGSFMNAKMLAYIIAHEIGHTLGAKHNQVDSRVMNVPNDSIYLSSFIETIESDRDSPVQLFYLYASSIGKLNKLNVNPNTKINKTDSIGKLSKLNVKPNTKINETEIVNNYIMDPYTSLFRNISNIFFAQPTALNILENTFRRGLGCFGEQLDGFCGDGIIDSNETCDSIDPCCSPPLSQNPCHYVSAQVECLPSSGTCCDENCKLKSSVEVCSEQSDCTSLSFCDGHSAQCPIGPELEGAICNYGTGLCESGTCRNKICQLLNMKPCFNAEFECLETCTTDGVYCHPVIYQGARVYRSDGTRCLWNRGICQMGICSTQPYNKIIKFSRANPGKVEDRIESVSIPLD